MKYEVGQEVTIIGGGGFGLVHEVTHVKVERVTKTFVEVTGGKKFTLHGSKWGAGNDRWARTDRLTDRESGLSYEAATAETRGAQKLRNDCAGWIEKLSRSVRSLPHTRDEATAIAERLLARLKETGR